MRTALENSLDQILRCEKQELGRNFYTRLFEACPEARPFFEGIDVRAQAKILVNSLQVIVSHAVHGYPSATQYLLLIGARHRTRGISPGLFPVFCSCLLETIAEFHGDHWNEMLTDEWRRALDSAAGLMVRGYNALPTY